MESPQWRDGIPDYRCPGCGAFPLHPMGERHRYCCFACQKVFAVGDVIKLAVLGRAAEIPGVVTIPWDTLHAPSGPNGG